MGRKTNDRLFGSTSYEVERGSAQPLVALLMVAVFACMYLLVLAGSAVNESARAQTAADASALAAVVGGEAQATTAAQANGGRLVFAHVDAGVAEVEVAVGKATARAKARLDGPITTKP